MLRHSVVQQATGIPQLLAMLHAGRPKPTCDVGLQLKSVLCSVRNGPCTPKGSLALRSMRSVLTSASIRTPSPKHALRYVSFCRIEAEGQMYLKKSMYTCHVGSALVLGHSNMRM